MKNIKRIIILILIVILIVIDNTNNTQLLEYNKDNLQSNNNNLKKMIEDEEKEEGSHFLYTVLNELKEVIGYNRKGNKTEYEEYEMNFIYSMIMVFFMFIVIFFIFYSIDKYVSYKIVVNIYKNKR